VHVSGTTRSAERASALQSLGFDVFACHGDDEEPSSVFSKNATIGGGVGEDEYDAFVSERLQYATCLIATAGPGESGEDPFLFQHGQNLSVAKHLQCACYLSSTSAYGEHGGDWVSEDTAPISPGSKGIARLEAEGAWTSALTPGSTPGNARLCILRLAGIYGPGRSALDTLLKRPIPTTAAGLDGAQEVTSRVHVDDIVATVAASMDNERANGVYNVADDTPASREEVFAYARELLRSGAAGPACRKQLIYLERLAASLRPETAFKSRRDLERASKRVLNHRLRQDLLSELHFPSYKEGLSDIAAAYASNS
jgi:nucleoside-diphosphate-sugar epimerase